MYKVLYSEYMQSDSIKVVEFNFILEEVFLVEV